MSNIVFINFYKHINTNIKYNLYCFDLDYTIIKPKSNNIFPKNIDDWIFINNVENKFKNIINNNNLIIIFSNQKNKKEDEIMMKINNIHRELGIDFIFICSLQDDIYRKPRIGMWKYLLQTTKIKINKKNCLYVGDMAGRITDKYDTDIKFALNLNIKFLTPEQYFYNNNEILNYELSGYLLDNYSNNTKININIIPKQMIILGGYPSSGKTYLANKLCKYNFTLLSRDELKNNFNKMLNSSLQNNKSVVIEGLHYNNNLRNIYINLAKQYNYQTIYIHITTSYELSNHLNLYRYLYQNKNKVPIVVYNKYKKYFEYPNSDQWNIFIEYHPNITKKINKYFLY
jgi:bifunctional polynucleotide phosphatase/kinase